MSGGGGYCHNRLNIIAVFMVVSEGIKEAYYSMRL